MEQKIFCDCIFIDKVEISNPGGLVKGLKEEDLGKKSFPRNPLLFDLISRTPNVEKAGTRIKRIRDAMKEYNLEVDFKSTGFFTATLFRENIGSKKTSEKTSEKIIYFIKQNPEISAEKLGQEIEISSRAVEMQLSKLKDEGRIKRIGPAKGGYWKVLE